MPAPEAFDARHVASRMLTPGVRELVHEREGGRPVEFAPGQWVNLVLPVAPRAGAVTPDEPGDEIRRAYSIASAPSGSGRFEIAVTRVSGGPGSEYLHTIPVGSTLRALGPHGLFTRAPTDETPAIFVATGTGVTPLRSMMQAALGAGSRAPMWLLFGARYEEDILYREEFEAWARRHPGVAYHVTLSQPRGAWTGRRGYVQAHLAELYGELASRAAGAAPHVYVCGLDRMVKTVRELSRHSIGVDRKHVHAERYD